MRFVNKADNPNKGFTANEISILSNRIYIHPNNVFLEFLKNAGKKSNVLDADFKDLGEFIAFQNDFNSLLKNDLDISLDSKAMYCFQCEQDYYKNKLYYFVKTEESGNPKVFYYSNGSIPIGVNFRDERTENIGLVALKKNFVEYLADKTDQKFGTTIGEKIRNTIWTFLTFPVWLPILIALEIRKRL